MLWFEHSVRIVFINAFYTLKYIRIKKCKWASENARDSPKRLSDSAVGDTATILPVFDEC